MRYLLDTNIVSELNKGLIEFGNNNDNHFIIPKLNQPPSRWTDPERESKA